MLALSSVILFIFSFPNFNQPWCAWIALVPWLLLLRDLSPSQGRVLPLAPHSRPRRDALSASSPVGGVGAPLASPAQSFWWSWLIGFFFFLGSIWWLSYVTLVGWIILCAYLALFFGGFGVIVYYLDAVRGSRFTVLLISAAWISLEYLRSHLLSGFGWNLLAYSQASWLPVIQMADITGAWGVSFLVVGVNVCALFIGECQLARRARGRKKQGRLIAAQREALSFLVVVACALGYGVWRIRFVIRHPGMRVAVVQGNIPQSEKWDEAFQERILRRYEALTRTANATTPDLIVWPETSAPGYLGVDEELTQRLINLAVSTEKPLLIGAPFPHFTPEGFRFFNRATLIDHSGELIATYDKLHLVPFGEFIPGEQFLPWIRKLLPPIGDFVPGRAHTVFRPIDRPDGLPPFSVLICFEDVFPELARRFVQEGARMLFVITNDGWFGPTAAAYQHAQASTFRAVELRVPVARAANTGWSGCIDVTGRWIGAVHDERGTELFAQGTHTCDLGSGSTESVYVRWGDWFAWLCLVITVGWLSQMWLIEKRFSSRKR